MADKGVGKARSTCRESVDVRRPGLRMPAQRADPVVEVVEDDEEDVGLLRSGLPRRDRKEEKSEAELGGRSHSR